MKSNQKRVLFTGLALTFALFAEMPISALTNSKSSNAKEITAHKYKEKAASSKIKEPGSKTKETWSKAKEAEQAGSEETLLGLDQTKLAQVATAFQNKPDDNTYNELWNTFVSFTEQAAAKHKDPVHLFRSWKVLSQAGLKIVDPIGSSSHIYSFNHIISNNISFMPQTKSALIQWSDQIVLPPAATVAPVRSWKQKKSRAKKVKTVSTIKTQAISIPSYVDLKEATLLPHATAVVKASETKWIKGKKISKVSKANKVSKVIKTITPIVGHYLALMGTDIQSGHTWFSGLKQSSSGWLNYSELFQDVPIYLLQSNGAKARFSGNTLVITMGGSSGYELVMPWVSDRFAFSTREAQDSSSAVAHQFLLALQNKRPDLAKIWLADPKLVSIPGYLGLFSSSAEGASLKLVGMPASLSGGSRFRIITGGRNDLIIDVAKIKTQLLIKAVFIAPGLTRPLTPATNSVIPSTINK